MLEPAPACCPPPRPTRTVGGSDGTRPRGAAAEPSERRPQDRVGRPEPARRGVDAEPGDTARAQAAVDGQVGGQRRDADVVERGDGDARPPGRAQPRRGRRAPTDRR